MSSCTKVLIHHLRNSKHTYLRFSSMQTIDFTRVTAFLHSCYNFKLFCKIKNSLQRFFLNMRHLNHSIAPSFAKTLHATVFVKTHAKTNFCQYSFGEFKILIVAYTWLLLDHHARAALFNSTRIKSASRFFNFYP